MPDDAPGTTEAPAPQNTPATPPPAAPTTPPPAATPPPPPAAPADWEGEFNAERARATIEKQREEVKALKADAQMMAAIKRSLGLDKQLPADTGELQGLLEAERKEREADRQALKNERINNALLRNITAQHGDIDVLTNYLRGSGSLDDLDPSAENFEKTLSGRIKAIIEKNPKFKVDNVPPASGATFPAGSGGKEPITAESLSKMSPEAIVAARAAGELQHLGIHA